MCVTKEKEKEKLLSSDYDPLLKSSYSPSEKDELWVSFRGQYGVNPLRSDVSKILYNNIKALCKLKENI